MALRGQPEADTGTHVKRKDSPLTHSLIGRLRRSSAIGLTGLLAATPLAAQDSDDTSVIALDEIMVQSASGGETTVQDAPASISVIDSETIEKEGARELTDVLRKIPGLNLTRGNSGINDVSFRGMSSSRTLYLVNGKRISSSGAMLRDYQGDLSTIPVDAIDRIEVVRGPMSTLYGSDAMGGVINIITKEPGDIWSGSVTAEYTTGSDDTTAPSRQISGYFSGKLSETVNMAIWGKYSKQDAPKPFTYVDEEGEEASVSGTLGSKVHQIGTSLTWSPSSAVTWGVEATHSQENYLAYDDHDGNRLKKTGVALTNDWQIAGGTLSTYLRYEHSTNEPWESDGYWGDAIEYDTVTLESRYNNFAYIADRELEYTFGLDVARDKLKDNQPNRNNAEIGGSVVTGALYAEGRYQVTDALKLTAGLRLDQHEEYGLHVTPRIYANYDLGSGLMLKAGYSQAFVAPDLRSLNPDYLIASRGNGCKPYPGPCNIIGNPDLEPETSDNYEIGLNYQGAGLSWEVTAFYNDVTNMFGAMRTGEQNESGYDIFQRTNIDEGRTAGVEGGMSFDVSPDLTWSNTFTWIALSEFKYDFMDETYPMATTPELNIPTGLSWRANDRLTLNGQVTYVGRQAGYITEASLGEDEANAVPAGQNSDPYFLVDVGMTYDVTDNARVNFGIDNLFDQQPDDTVSYRENGRLFRVGLTTRF